MSGFALSGVTVIDGTGSPPRENGVVVVRGDRIAEVFRLGERALPDDVPQRGAPGAWVVPGLVEAHCHLAGLAAQGLADRVMPLLPRYGITAVRDTGGPDTDLTWRTMKEGRAGWPRFFGSGPVIDGWPGGPFPGLWKTNDSYVARNWVRLLAQQGVDFVKTYVWLAPDVLAAVVEQAHELGLKVAAHVGLDVTAGLAVDLGVDALEHVRIGPECVAPELRARVYELPRRAMDEIGDHRAWRFIDPDGPLAGELIERMVAAGTFLTPTLAYSQSILEPEGTLQRRESGTNDDVASLSALLPPESFTSGYTEDDRVLARREFAGILRFVGRCHEAGVKICVGTDSPSAGGVLPGIAYHNELELLVRCGMSPADALHAATGRAAELLDVEGELGTISPGAVADLVVLDSDPLVDLANLRRVRTVYIGGEQVVG